jgi:hypothetical protein
MTRDSSGTKHLLVASRKKAEIASPQAAGSVLSPKKSFE